LNQDLLEEARNLESISLGLIWGSNVLSLSPDLFESTRPKAEDLVDSGVLLKAHQKLSSKMLNELRQRNKINEGSDFIEILPKTEPVCRIVGLHGAYDNGRGFVGVFAELIDHYPVHVICPSSIDVSWSKQEQARVIEMLSQLGTEKPIFLVGLSSGANTIFELAKHFADRVRGVVAIASAPWRINDSNFDSPILYVHGTKDTVFSFEELQSFVEKNPTGSTLARVNNWGHAFPYRLLLTEVWPWIEAHL
jgi:predicted esterase